MLQWTPGFTEYGGGAAGIYITSEVLLGDTQIIMFIMTTISVPRPRIDSEIWVARSVDYVHLGREDFHYHVQHTDMIALIL